MHRIPVRTANDSYDVVVESGSLEAASRHLQPIIGDRRIFLIADQGAWQHQGARLAEGLEGLDTTVIQMVGGEENKRLKLVESLADQMYEAGADRSACVIAFGGGIAGDVGGFVAAGYMRGLDVVQVPTTLLAQVDAAVGGKTGVNLAEGKNLFGAFHQPRLVLIDPTTLRTLPEREYRAGLFEVIKHGIIWSPSLFELMHDKQDAVLARDPAVLEAIIAESVAIKAEVVSKDEREGNLRRILNYGHTLGHALEAETAYARLLHGEAVAYGMVAAARLAESLEMLSRDEARSLEDVVLSYGPIPALDGIEASNLAARIRGDKKTIGGHVHFVLPEKIGKVRVLSDIDSGLIVEAAESALRTFSRATNSPEPAVRESVASDR
jgi:3-dehydroquinate synthase